MRVRFPYLLVLAASLLGQQPAVRSGIHPEDMDLTCKPCTDFYRYVNGGWLDKNPIPASQSSWGPFGVLAAANRERIRTILDVSMGDAFPAGSPGRKMGDFCASCLDTRAIDARGISPLKPDFDRIEAIHSVQDLGAVLASFQLWARPNLATNGSVAGPFRVTSAQDPKNPNRMLAVITEREGVGRPGSAVFSLPDRDYYFRKDEKSVRIREEFVKHVAKMLELSGAPADRTGAQAAAVLNFETSLAEAVMTIPEKRDPEKIYHLTDLAGLSRLAPAFNWADLFHEAGIPASAPVNVTEPELLKKVNDRLTGASLEDWKIWLRWRTLHLSAHTLSSPFVTEDFRFEKTVLSGIEQPLPRWEFCANTVDRDMGDALGKAYVEKYFSAEARRRMADMVENLRAALREKLEQATWMQPETRKNAMAKLAALRVKIGYPDAWNGYETVQPDRAHFFENVRNAWSAVDRAIYAKIGKPVSRLEWSMTTPTVNAYSNAGKVEIVFPAGILQPPYFDLNADDAANYGAIGAVIGHEMGHQFDDGGSKFDATGALNNWWTGEDRKEFEKRTACVVDEFNTLDVGDGLHHNGRLVLGEALGDLNGIRVAYAAYHHSLAGKPEPPPLDGYTSDQRFFIAFARVWGSQMRPDAMRLSLNTNPHPLSKFRAIGTLQNIPEFHRAFQCKEGDPMVRPAARQCFVW